YEHQVARPIAKDAVGDVHVAAARVLDLARHAGHHPTSRSSPSEVGRGGRPPGVVPERYASVSLVTRAGGGKLRWAKNTSNPRNQSPATPRLTRCCARMLSRRRLNSAGIACDGRRSGMSRTRSDDPPAIRIEPENEWAWC